jgi:hypothetical protein
MAQPNSKTAATTSASRGIGRPFAERCVVVCTKAVVGDIDVDTVQTDNLDSGQLMN